MGKIMKHINIEQINEDLKDTGSSVFLERNLATKIINITKAKVDV